MYINIYLHIHTYRYIYIYIYTHCRIIKPLGEVFMYNQYTC